MEIKNKYQINFSLKEHMIKANSVLLKVVYGSFFYQ